MNNNEPINIFDFDGTLTTETWPKFWVWVKKFGYNGISRNDSLEFALAEYRKINLGNNLETFFGFFNDLLVSNNESLTNSELMEGEKYIEYNPGAINFLKKSKVQNYIASGGLVEFLKQLEIAKYFNNIYGTPVVYNKERKIVGIGDVMTDEKKILAIQDILKSHNRQKNDCRNVFYVGDGYSDAAAMRFVHNNGGKAIFVYQSNQNDDLYQYNKKVYETLYDEGIVDFCCVAEYGVGSTLYNLLQRQPLDNNTKRM